MFYEHYDANLQKILDFGKQTSGVHEIDMKKADLWVRSQINPQRRRAAKALLDNTHYITFNDLFKSIERIIESVYVQVINPDEKVYLYVDEPDHSNYFMSVLAVYFIRSLEYQDPILVYSDTKIDLTNKTLLIIDDMAYSGTQISKLLIENLRISKETSKIIIGLVGVSNRAKIMLCGQANYLYANMIFPDLIDVLDMRQFLEVSYYFAPTEKGEVMTSVYFDHKIPDWISIFNIAILVGPILPQDLGYEPLDKHGIDKLGGIFSRNNWKSYVPLIESIHEDDKKDFNLGSENIKLQFLPFIATCLPPKLDIGSEVSYFNFITGGSHFKQNDMIQTKDDRKLYGYIWDYMYNLRKSIGNEICIFPFYKSGLYAMK